MPFTCYAISSFSLRRAAAMKLITLLMLLMFSAAAR